MNFLFLSIGLLIGMIAGAGIAFVLMRKMATDAQQVAETVSATVVAKQAEQILQLAETKLSGKKDVIDGTLKAMKDDLGRVERLMQDVGKGHEKLDTRLGEAAKVIKDLGDTTGSLKNALASNSARGSWGERMAEDVLRLSGLIEGINFIKQQKIESTGSKPDFTFLLPQQLKLNMDVKFPFNNYQLYTEAAGQKEKDGHKDKFLKDVRNRLKEIQTRDYINPDDNTVDYVLLFVPNEQIFAFINEHDRSLIDDAMKAKTILCSPLSLYAILAVIRQSIDTFHMETKSREILSVLGSFKMQWEKFKEQMALVKTRLDSAQKGYDELTGARERQLDRHLVKIDDMRAEQGIQSGMIEEAFEKAAQKQIATQTIEVR